MLKILLISLLIIATPARSDILSLADGHIVDQAQFQELTLDVASRSQPDSQRVGVRATLPRFLNHYALFLEANSSQGDWNDIAINGGTEFDGTGTGAGVYITGFSVSPKFSTTFKLAYNNEENNINTLVTIGGRVADVDQELRTFSATMLLSPNEPIMQNGLGAYAALGLIGSRSSRRVYIEQQEVTTLARLENPINAYLAAGLVYPLARFRLYAVAEFQEQLSLSLGIRWHVTKTAE